MSSSTAIPASSGVGIDRDDTDLARATMRRVSLRLLPFLFLIYIFNFLDRTNVAIAALQMNRDLGFSATAYGFGAGIFSLGYALFEVPSNLVLARVGARFWIARIMITWGLVAAAMMFVHTPIQFYVLRFLLGVAEAGFFPGIVYYLSGWFPAPQRARALSRFLIAIPISAAIGNPLSAGCSGSTACGDSPDGSGSSSWKAFRRCFSASPCSRSSPTSPLTRAGSPSSSATGLRHAAAGRR